ncbi:hypothetical protein LK09_13240 [Microbacterium mangrovi]|uniref:Uncharacterized protein n=1 Tax=Microbacterium mangrovi TaxID=1348253 RepID=A0A0B2A170_9MICO|nr:amidohydrolase family protein [Microbacterium mangrovi]KHK97210.1 hypothetical protein LK09_13240 [Microbacterium mangrovi]
MSDLDALQAWLGPGARPARHALTGQVGVALPPFVDHHVHLHLFDPAKLAEHGIAGVLDLGGDPDALARRECGIPEVAYAGALLTARGGYPVGRAWAPDAVVREVASSSAAPGAPGGARTAVDEMADAGASFVKVVLHAGAPTLSDDTLSAIIEAARTRGLPVVAHAEGAGMAQQAVRHGVDALAHVPFTEHLHGETIAAAVADGMLWMSTLAIHAGSEAAAVARSNLERFAASGGRVLYGTDLGNDQAGPQAVGVSVAELSALQDAGIRGPELVRTLTDAWPRGVVAGLASFVAGAPPAEEHALPEWLASARVLPAEELVAAP